MIDSQNDLYYLFEEMVRRGLVSSDSRWIEVAARYKSTQLPVGIAASKVLVYDAIDRRLLRLTGSN